jgi:hypothetical protein
MHFVPTINTMALEYDRNKTGRSLLQSDTFKDGNPYASRVK